MTKVSEKLYSFSFIPTEYFGVDGPHLLFPWHQLPRQI